MTTYLVCGGRDFTDMELMTRELDDRPVSAIVHGDCRGADRLAGEWAKLRGHPEIIVPANWKFYDKEAGFIRNTWMLKLIPFHVVLAFPGGGGTANMVAQARQIGVPVKEIADEIPF